MSNPFKTKTYTLLMLASCMLLMPLGVSGANMDYTDFLPPGQGSGYNRVVPKPPLREADVKFSRRIVRCIDTRQKMNKQLEWPRQPLSGLLYAGLREGSIISYKSDSLSSFYNTDEFKSRGGYEMVVFISTDPNDPTIGYDTSIWVEYEHTKIHKYWVMEDWIFDYKLSVFSPRIIALAPVFKPEYSMVEGSEQPLCWIRMDEIRQLLSNTKMFNRYNDAAMLSYDDFFQMRIFDSYIVYESNVFDQFIHHFEEFENDKVGALLKSDEIKNDLFIFEHDLWQF
jgi:gliding motility associated protien GldN